MTAFAKQNPVGWAVPTIVNPSPGAMPKPDAMPKRSAGMPTARRPPVFLLAAGLLALTGCGVAIRGHWSLERATPNKATFSVDDATFNGDGTFEATLTIDGRTARETGTYQYKFNKLYLRPAAGGQRKFTAVVELKKLKIINGEQYAYLRKTKKEKGEGK